MLGIHKACRILSRTLKLFVDDVLFIIRAGLIPPLEPCALLLLKLMIMI